ncbi:hypothetical protein MZM54_05110 [[Brevibacterium] frigoritolerans]|nr:hypothetical protein [Peribacillus frigoritolerans]
MTDLELEVKSIIEANGGKRFAEDVMTYGCQSGCVTALIYYRQTHEWFDKHYEDIMDLKETYENMTGDKLSPDGDLKNWYAWFSFEIVTRDLYDELF